MKLYIGNLPYQATSKDLLSLCLKYGEVVEAMIIPSKGDRRKSKGFGFVTFSKREDGERALKLNGKEYRGRKLVVAPAKEGEQIVYESRG